MGGWNVPNRANWCHFGTLPPVCGRIMQQCKPGFGSNGIMERRKGMSIASKCSSGNSMGGRVSAYCANVSWRYAPVLPKKPITKSANDPQIWATVIGKPSRYNMGHRIDQRLHHAICDSRHGKVSDHR